MNIKNYKALFILLFSFIFSSLTSFASEYTMEELNELRRLNAITEEEYEILKMEITQGSVVQDGVYTLKVNGKSLSRNYKVITENGKEYFELQEFFAVIGFSNYYPKKDGTTIYLGESLEEIKLDYKKDKVFRQGEEVFPKEKYQKIILKGNSIYLEKDIFRELFLQDLRAEPQKLEIAMELGFTPPVAISQLLDISMAKLEREEDINEIIYSGKREFFNLGYLRVQSGNSWTKTEGDKNYKSEWDGKLSYQGGLLYGGFQFDYDVKEKEFSNFRLDYDHIWKSHTLEINRSNFDSNGEWGFHFYKDKGYYDLGDTIVIRERVPVGSRAELLYMGTPIAIKNEENGEVIFANNMIRSDRDYQLKVYYPDGKIIMKDIRTSKDYNRQRQGEIEYDIKLNENASENGYTSDLNFYYGVTDKFTFGAGISRDIIKNVHLEKDYMTTLNTELTYGDTLNGYSYTLQLNGEKTLNFYYDETNQNLRDRNQLGYLIELTKNRWRTRFEQKKYMKYYEEKERNNFQFSYDLTDALRVNYAKGSTKYRGDRNSFGSREKEKSSSVGASYDKVIGGVLFGTSANFDLEDRKNNEYSFNAYYSGFKKFTTKLENTWTNNGKNYEVALNIYNNNLGGFLDISAKLKYSNKDKETFGLTFSMTLDSWFTLGMDGDEHGNNTVRVGVDRIIDLKNPKLEVDNMDVSRANIVTFVDNNNNNMYDEGEPRVSGVEVTLGNHKVVTDKNGEAKLYNLSNGIMYELQPKIKKPSYTMGNNVIKLQSNFSSDVDVYIPIKPMMNLNGYVRLDKTLDIKPNKIDEFYSNIIIQILDKNGKEIDLASPDNTGYFDISGLFPEEYLIKVYYIGDDYSIINLNEKLQLKYDEENGFDFDIQLNITNEQIELLNKEKLAKLEKEKIVKNTNNKWREN